MSCGLWVLCGFLVFVIAEKLFNGVDDEADSDADDPLLSERNRTADNNVAADRSTLSANGTTKINGTKKELTRSLNGVKQQPNGLKIQSNGYANGFAKINGANGYSTIRELSSVHDDNVEDRTRERPKLVTGYLNLMANCVDNFTHGLAVGGSFLVSLRLGALTTFAILIHEIPHEIGDFAILLRSGFNRWDAAKLQLLTAGGGICGSLFAIVFSGDAIEAKTSWILPFTAGGFLHIGLVTVLPELLQETKAWESLKQMCALLTGVIVMAFLTIMVD